MAILNGKISRRTRAPRVLSNELPSGFKKDADGNFYKRNKLGEWVKLETKEESFKEFFGIDSEENK